MSEQAKQNESEPIVDRGANSAPIASSSPSSSPPTVKYRMSMKQHTLTLIGYIVSGAVGYIVGTYIESTGWFGPTMETVVSAQQANFDDIRSKLDALSKAAPGSPEAAQLQKELGELIATQEALTDRTHSEMSFLQAEVVSLRAQLLDEKGVVSGADFWLAPGESVTLRERGNVFSLRSRRRPSGNPSYAFAVSLSGANKNLFVGDFIEFTTSDSNCRVILKTEEARPDGRFGFDLVCTPK